MGLPIDLDSEEQQKIDRIVSANRLKHNLLYPCALKPNGDIVLWNQVGQGEYYCTESTCIDDNGSRRRLRYIPTKDPTKQRSYFRHHRGQTGCTETVVHREAVNIIAHCRNISIPPMSYNPGNDFYTAGDFSIINCCPANDRAPDRLIPDGAIFIDGYPVMVEITVTHNTDAEKIRTLARAGLPVLEIRLAVRTAVEKYESEHGNDFEKYILHRARRRWLFHPDIDSDEEPDLTNEDWVVTFASQYKRRLIGHIRASTQPSNPVIEIMQSLSGIPTITDDNIKSGWFTTISSVWQSEVILHELLESVSFQGGKYHIVSPSGEESYQSLDARARCMSYRINDVEYLTNLGLTDIREDMVKPCISLLERMNIPFRLNSSRSITINVEELSLLTMTYRIIKSVKSLADDGMDAFSRSDDIVRSWAEKRQIFSMTHAQKISELVLIDSFAHDVRMNQWDGETIPCGLDEGMLDLFIMRIKAPFGAASSKAPRVLTEDDEKWQKASEAFKAHEARTPSDTSGDSTPHQPQLLRPTDRPLGAIDTASDRTNTDREISPGWKYRLKRINSRKSSSRDQSPASISNAIPAEHWREKLENAARKKYHQHHGRKSEEMARLFMTTYHPRLDGKPIDICVDEKSYELCLSRLK